MKAFQHAYLQYSTQGIAHRFIKTMKMTKLGKKMPSLFTRHQLSAEVRNGRGEIRCVRPSC
jgi:hypothetical protein